MILLVVHTHVVFLIMTFFLEHYFKLILELYVSNIMNKNNLGVLYNYKLK